MPEHNPELNKEKAAKEIIDKGVEEGWVRFWDSSRSFEKLELDNVDPDKMADVSDEEYNSGLAEERALRAQLWKVDIHGKTPQEVLELIQRYGLPDVLKEWARVHRRNSRLTKKRGIPVFISPQSDLLLLAVELL